MTIIKKQRYPQDNKLFVLDVLTVAMGFSILSAVPWPVQSEPWLQSATGIIVVAGAMISYIPKWRQFAKLKDSVRGNRKEVALRIDNARVLKRKALTNAFQVILVVAIPAIFVYILDPIGWVILVVTCFLSFVVGRLAFFIAVRRWEGLQQLDLHTVINRVDTPKGEIAYERLIVVDEKEKSEA